MRLQVVRKQPNAKMCFVCGVENDYGLKAMFYELESNLLLAQFTPQNEHQGYPGRLHGGIIGSILDETIGRAVMIGHTDSVWGVTVAFDMKLRKPVDLGCEVRVLARVSSEGKRSFSGEGVVLTRDGSVAAEGRGRYLKMDIENIADFDHKGDEWKVVSVPEDKAEIEVVLPSFFKK